MKDPFSSISVRSDAAYFLKATLVGILVGGLATGFHTGLDFLFAHYAALRQALGPGYMPYVVSMAISAACVTGAYILVKRVAPEAAGSGIQEIEGAMEDKRPLHWPRVLIAKFFGGLLALGSGLVLGREGPTIHMGAMTAEALSRSQDLSGDDHKGLLAAGAAAGLAAAFNAPLAAILFIVEETRRQFPFGYRTYMAVIIASILSAAITEQLTSIGPPLQVDVGFVPVWSFALLAVLGLFLGALGVFFNRALITVMDLFLKIPSGLRWVPAVVIGAATGILLNILPAATGGGEELVHDLILTNYGVITLLVLTLLRFGGVLFSYASGVPGGIFAPMLSIATCAGLAFGVASAELLPVDDDFRSACAVAAMGGFFAASVRAPLVGVVLVMELTGAYSLIMPVLITCTTASLTAHHLGGRPIYEELLERSLRLAGEPVDGPSGGDKTPVQLGTREL
ncbi:chloride channel protein [Stappia aggregata IAM 12614]|uniref:Chloride channel protein n=1 Tax=Roseibium aggregatum (strain ATCC 25650 / DSM 13394 / JCM 20685 / NBRC 16684 / NCIMB 2208 / IAM 12614 / B1) TaxID=384765 RepID=A0NUZ8_ROSAI|nr:H(+)/Cl(-) exchange transporter ClcA [Roseibium aggregatum]EAV43265.1 chloride channel protein [Stappia aggregata IAM 12614] [Roseibium aggregatum IAM 12614]